MDFRMGRDNPLNRLMRQRIAHSAARLMAEDGIEDFGLAKRKAAKQLGAADTRNLPDNAEVEAALRAYQQLYQADEQEQRTRALRLHAADMMRELGRFNPHLVGPVLNGSAGRYATIELQVFTDSVKDVELHLLNRGMTFRTRDEKFWVGDEVRMTPVHEFETDDARFEIAVFRTEDARVTIKSSAEGRTIDRMKLDGLEQVLAQSHASNLPAP